MVLPATQLLSNLQLCLLLLVLVNQGNGFFLLVLLGECELLGSCVHLPVWLMSNEFPETESPAGFAALEGSARFTGPAHKGRRPKNWSSNSQRPPLWSSHSQGLLRGLFLQVSPRRACLRVVPRLLRSPGIAFQVLQPAGRRTLSSTPVGAQRDPLGGRLAGRAGV